MILEPDHTLTPEKRQKKWQSRKDSNLNKMNQNHLCYRYTTGLRTMHNIPVTKKNASDFLKKNDFFCCFLKKSLFQDCKS